MSKNSIIFIHRHKKKFKTANWILPFWMISVYPAVSAVFPAGALKYSSAFL